MRIGVISDTHNEVERTRVAVDIFRGEGVEALFHCGDITTPPIIEICAELPLWFVFGNHDADNVPALQAAAKEFNAVSLGWVGTVELEGRRIAVTHGLMRYDVRQAMKSRPDYFLSGHSHEIRDEMEGTVRRINPGAIHRVRQPTIVVIDLDSAEAAHIGIE